MSYARKSNHVIVEALIESLREQLPEIGVEDERVDEEADIPTLEDLQEIVQECEDDGLFDEVDDVGTVANGNYGAEQLAIVLVWWAFANQVNRTDGYTNLHLVIVMPNGENPRFLTPFPEDESHAIYIFNDNRGANNHGGSHVPQNDRYQGMSLRDGSELDDDSLASSDDELSV